MKHPFFPIEEYIDGVTPPPQQLFHYTSMKGLYGIISTGEIWATQIGYLNDRSEFNHAVDIAKLYLEWKLEERNLPKDLLNLFLKSLTNMENVGIYVCSFTENGDLLSQWRAYSGSSAGYSIGFDSESLSNSPNYNLFYLFKCIYDEVEQRNIIEKLFEYHFNKFIVSKGEFLIDIVFHDFLIVAALLKDQRFSEEKEWRLISSKQFTTDRLNFRMSDSTLIPYYSIPINEIKIEKIICGANPNEALSQHALSSFLFSKGRGGTKVEMSKVPLRKL